MASLVSALRRTGSSDYLSVVSASRILEVSSTDAYIATTFVGSRSNAPAGLSAVRWEEGAHVGRRGQFGLVLRNENGYREAGGVLTIEPIDEKRSSIRAEVRILSRNPLRTVASFEHEVDHLLDEITEQVDKRVEGAIVS